MCDRVGSTRARSSCWRSRPTVNFKTSLCSPGVSTIVDGRLRPLVASTEWAKRWHNFVYADNFVKY